VNIGKFQVSLKLDIVQLPRGSFYRARASTRVIPPTVLLSFVTSLIRFQPSVGHLHTITAWHTRKYVLFVATTGVMGTHGACHNFDGQ
jgi:hypothetical protein